MKIQQIQFPLNLGIADELRVFTRDDLETENSITVHYILIDTTKTTDIGHGQEIPYKVMHSDKTIIEGDNYLKYKENTNYITEIIITKLGVALI